MADLIFRDARRDDLGFIVRLIVEDSVVKTADEPDRPDHPRYLAAFDAIAADIMAYGSRMAESRWMLPFALIHDQGLALKLIGQTPDGFSQALATLPPWAHGLPLKVETKTAPYYSK